MEDHEYYVYLLASRSRTLYIGVTNFLLRSIREHREGTGDSFTARHRIHRLVYFERFVYIGNAIKREKYLKHFMRAEKIALIQKEIRRGGTWRKTSYRPIRQCRNQQKQILPRCGRMTKVDGLIGAYSTILATTS